MSIPRSSWYISKGKRKPTKKKPQNNTHTPPKKTQQVIALRKEKIEQENKDF